MAEEGFFKSIRNSLSEGTDEALNEFVEPIDVSITEPELSEFPSFTYSPSTEGAEEAVGAFYYSARGFGADEGREVQHLDVRYRQEHEPYRYEPDGDQVVWVTKAHLYEVHPLTNSINIHELQPLNIKALDNCVVYAEFNTNEQGAIIDGDDPKEGKYRLKVAEELPSSTHFELMDEAGANGVEGYFAIPLFYIENKELLRDHWNNEGDDEEDENNPRGVQLFGGLKGHRGPMWWHRGYNQISNLGSGKNIYKDYLKFTDEKRLRSLNKKGQSLSSPFTGNAQVNVEYNDASTEIEIYGNRYNKHWKINNVGVGVVEDGLVTCLSDLDATEFTTRDLNTVNVLTSSGTATALTSGSTTSVVGNPTLDDYASVVTQSGISSVWTGGASQAGAGLSIFKVAESGGSGNVWVMGIAATGQYASTAPTFPALITGATLTNTSTVNVLKDVTPVDVLTSSGTATVLTGGSTVSVYQAHSSATKFLEAPSSSSDASAVKVVKSPEGSSDLCPS